ncbi:MAG: PTS system mannose/fructose/sorbose family transporter subunit IID [Atopobiaceae bacterium]|nr:PTS system mannose/fructose/sorbose family transporter subunit IID [Atopobiaceae bacterium]MCI2172656.1 PTS system mannose/fructose/sorbose family transporter subunit IID [Atopobiaceae bacterium]MCI2206963.1 PTS system mannose/fructose/sorbose family transporter subunit IID [Atopobiaceae bacterium]
MASNDENDEVTPTAANGEKLGKLTSQDITKLGLLSIFEQIAFSFERMQAPGFTSNMLPAFKKIYGDSDEDLKEFMTYNMEFMNTEPHMATLLQGVVLSMEEKHEDRELIKGVRNGLFGPLAGLGDSIFWFTILPITAAISCSLAQSGSILGPIIFIAVYLVVGLSRIFFAHLGYGIGNKALTSIGENTKYLTKAAGILGTTVIGALIPSYVTVAFADTLVFGVDGSSTVQSVFNQIMPNILPLAVVFAIYALFKKKHANVMYIILGIILISILMSFLGWM